MFNYPTCNQERLELIREDKEYQLRSYIDNMNLVIPNGSKSLTYSRVINNSVKSNYNFLNKYYSSFSNKSVKKIDVSANELLTDIVNLYIMHRLNEINIKNLEKTVTESNNKNASTLKNFNFAMKENNRLINDNKDLRYNLSLLPLLTFLINIFWFVYLFLGPKKLLDDIKEIYILFETCINKIIFIMVETTQIIFLYFARMEIDYSQLNIYYLIGSVIGTGLIYLLIKRKRKKD